MSTPGDSGSGARLSADGGRGSSSRAPTPSSAPSDVPALEAAPTPTGTDGQGPQGTDTDVIEIDDDVKVRVGSKRRLKSDVWNDFDKIEVGGIQKAECKWCKKHLSAVGRNGTSHLCNHVGSCDARQCRKGLKQKYVFDQGVARKELALMICVHEYPLSIVDHVGFRRFCAALQPLFKVVSRNTIRKDILDCIKCKSSL
ncbi:hypothetical protein HU200_036169 [Digitaria exilis]|uniref:BED-type domain-containing protein n=1 Tax=Digitaria exilis TaxID=1010633 RepID=A0A835EL72_9POAL|nr:hypothetical protein HU200_036169 [Digitaria exilis]